MWHWCRLGFNKEREGPELVFEGKYKMFFLLAKMINYARVTLLQKDVRMLPDYHLLGELSSLQFEQISQHDTFHHSLSHWSLG